MSGCCAFNCTNYQGKDPFIHFHRFPKKDMELERFAKWLYVVRRKNFKPSKNIVICSCHFKPSDYFESSLRGNLLKKDVVPSIFDFPDKLLPQSKPTNKEVAVQTTQSMQDLDNLCEEYRRKIKVLQQRVARRDKAISKIKERLKCIHDNDKEFGVQQKQIANNK